MIHEIKCLKEYFTLACAGLKTFEVRKNDRDYMPGDYVAMNEVYEEPIQDDEVELVYTGRSALFEISYVLDNPSYCKEGYVIFGILPCRVKTEDRITELTVMKRGQK